MGEVVGGVGEKKGAPASPLPLNPATEFSHLAPSSASLPRFRPSPASRGPPGIKLELAESSDMLITGLALL